MIRNSLVSRLLQEGLGPLYHATNVQALVAILNEDVLELGYSRGDSETIISRGYPFFASFSRTLQNRFRQYTSATIVVDGDALRARYKIVPVDYWQAGPAGSESEERLLSKEPEIRGFKKYILSMHVFYNARDHQLGAYDLLEYFGNCWFYANRQDYHTQRRGVLAADFLKHQTPANEPMYPHKDRSSRTLNGVEVLLTWLEKGGKGQSRSTGEDRWHRYLWSYPHDFVIQLSNEIGSLKSHPGVASRNFRKRMEVLLSKYGANSLRDFAMKFYDAHSPNGEQAMQKR